MRALLLGFALVACERDATYSIGWQPPIAGEQVEVITHFESHGAVEQERDAHIMVEHVAVDGDWITEERRRYLVYTVDGEPRPLGTYRVSRRGVDRTAPPFGGADGGAQVPAVERLDGPLTDDERAEMTSGARFALGDPAARKRLVTHQLKLDERYHLPPDEAEQLGIGGQPDVTLVLRAAHDDVRSFELRGTANLVGVRVVIAGTLDTTGPNYRYFHKVYDGDGTFPGGERVHVHVDVIQRRP